MSKREHWDRCHSETERIKLDGGIGVRLHFQNPPAVYLALRTTEFLPIRPHIPDTCNYSLPDQITLKLRQSGPDCEDRLPR